MISVNNISIAFNGVYLFENISFVINKKARIGLTGKNGAGKSTILKIIIKEIQADKGNISAPQGTTIGYLPQQMKYPEGKTVFNETISTFSQIKFIEQKIIELNAELNKRTDYESDEYFEIIEKINNFEEEFKIKGGTEIQANTEKTLKGLGFLPSDFNRDVGELSGGWRMRIELAKILLQSPDLLMLDEPTNHLDIESIEWLEDFLINYHGAIILISHDRIFLDNITKRTVEIANKKIYDYKFPYSKYEIQRKERMEKQIAAYQNQQKLIKDTEKFIERFRYKSTKAVQVQSRIKQLEKIERIEIDETDISNLSFKFPDAPRSGDIVVEMENLTKKYTEKTILKNLWLTIERGEKHAYIGKNGEGKTTLVKVIMNETEYEGNLKIGHNVNIGYFAQSQDKTLDNNKTVFQTIDDIAVGDVRTKIRDILGSFLFSGEDIDKKVKVLSGGERSRLALAKLMLQPYNLLILDEPTNHLDMHSKDMLKDALMRYNGTLIIVSHDRYFLDGLVDKIYEFANQTIKQHSGDIKLFLKKKKLQNLKAIEKKDKKNSENKNISENTDKKEFYLKRKEFDKNIRKKNKEIENTETEIENLETYIENTEKRLSAGEEIHDKLFYNKFENAKIKLETEIENWEKLNEELNILEQEKENYK